MTTTVHHYTAFGKSIISDFEFPELLSKALPHHVDADIVMRQGKVPTTLPESRPVDACLHINEDQFLFSLEGTVRCLGNGRETVIEPDPAGSSEAQRLALLGPIMATMAVREGCIPLNGSCIAVEGKAVVLLGSRDVGKSAAAAVLSRRGYFVLADDLLIVYPNEQGKYVVQPAYPRLKLWPDVLNQLEIDVESLPRIHPKLAKRSWPLEDYFYPDPLPVMFGIDMRFNRNPGVQLQELDGAGKLKALTAGLYASQVVSAMQGEPFAFRHLAGLANQMKMYRCKRSVFGTALRELAESIEETWK